MSTDIREEELFKTLPKDLNRVINSCRNVWNVFVVLSCCCCCCTVATLDELITTQSECLFKTERHAEDPRLMNQIRKLSEKLISLHADINSRPPHRLNNRLLISTGMQRRLRPTQLHAAPLRLP